MIDDSSIGTNYWKETNKGVWISLQTKEFESRPTMMGDLQSKFSNVWNDVCESQDNVPWYFLCAWKIAIHG